ncbi:two-component system response regulator ArcA [Thorsellia kenyensis]|uniref:Two-component system response regulator ArcA n=1 Tax=Thorsellia kenyensis TaxID=1549888 RepID=A0ABV6CD19_9GAMM
MINNTTPTLLIVEDEIVTRNTLKTLFEAEGYHVLLANNGDQMQLFLASHTVDLVLLDINLPGKNGLSLAREIRNEIDAGLIFLTGRDNEIDKILGLEIGADDYITKPFNPRELTIRVRNLLQRTMKAKQQALLRTEELIKQNELSVEPNTPSAHIYFYGWELNTDSHQLISPTGEAFQLPRSEYRALHHLCLHAGKIQSRQILLEKMTGREFKEHDRTVDVTIRRLRQYFESHPQTPEVIATVHGEGYRFTGEIEH